MMLARRLVIALLASLPLLATQRSKPKQELVIVGGGVAALHVNKLIQPFLETFHVTIIAPNSEHLMQAGQTFVAAHLMHEAQCKRSMQQLIGQTRQIVQRVVRYLPDEQRIVLQNNQSISYDELIIATGLEYNYDALKGLRQQMHLAHICSVYENSLANSSMPGAHKCEAWFHAIFSAASKRHVKILFIKSEGSIKCGGVTLSLLFMLDDFLKKQAVTLGKTVDYQILLAKPGKKLFGVEPYNAQLLREAKVRNITLLFDYAVTELASHSATFAHTFKKEVAYDEDFDEYSYEKKVEKRLVAFDFLHYVPPMQSEQALHNSPLTHKAGRYKGYGDVEVQSLRHLRYNNIAIIGDAAGVALGKTVASARQQAKIVVHNLVAKSALQYHGYSACPIKFGLSRALDARFDYDGALNPSSGATTHAFHKQLNDDVNEYWENVSV